MYIIASFILIINGYFANSDVTTARDLYKKGAKDKVYVEQLLKLTNNKKSIPLMKAYHGCALAMLAKYYINLISKLSTLRDGLKELNEVVSGDNKDVEIRFLRFSIEDSVPTFIPLEKHIALDKEYILSHLNNKHEFHETIYAYLAQSSSITSQELARVKK